MQEEGAPRHHGLRSRDRSGGRGVGRGSRDERHAEAYQQHEEKRYAGGDALLRRCVDVLVFHEHAHDEGREQHFDMDAVFGAVELRRGDVDRLRQGADHDGQPEDGFPVLPYVPPRLPAPAGGQQHDDDGDDGEHLPFEADHQDLQGDHQQDGVQVVENRQHLYLFVYPAFFEAQRREHREEDAGRGRGCETAQQQVFLPGFAAAPQRGRQQDENIVEYDEYPGQRRGGHGDEVVGRVGAPAGFVDLEFAPHVDHDEPQADVKQGVGAGFEACVSCTERPREELGDDESQHQEQGEGEDFSH